MSNLRSSVILQCFNILIAPVYLCISVSNELTEWVAFDVTFYDKSLVIHHNIIWQHCTAKTTTTEAMNINKSL